MAPATREEPHLARRDRTTGGGRRVSGLVTAFTALALPVGGWAVADLAASPRPDLLALAAVTVGMASRVAVPFLTIPGRSDRDRSGHGVVVAPGLALLPGGAFVLAVVLGVGLGWLARRLPLLTHAQPARRKSEVGLAVDRMTLAAGGAVATTAAGWWPANAAITAAVVGAIVFALLDALTAAVLVAVVEARPVGEVLRSGVPTAFPVETIALACGLFVTMVVVGYGLAPVWVLLAAAVAMALAAAVFETDHARTRYRSLVRLSTTMDTVTAPEQVERVVADTVAELVHASRGELREHPPQEHEIGVALNLPGRPQWLVMTDRLGMARQFTVRDRELLEAAGPLAAAAIADAIEHAGMNTMLGTDPLTGLANRRGLAERAPARLAEDARAGRHTVVAVLDVDGFKPINDDLGHDAGDEVLRTIGGQLDTAARRHDVVGRLGGDEFVVVAGGLPTPAVADEVVDRLRRRLDGLTAADGRPVHVSLGVAVAPADGTDVDALLHLADRRMYAEKRPRT